MGTRGSIFAPALAALLGPALCAQDASRISDEPIPPQVDAVPDRTRPLLELGDPFLGAGALHPGVEIPGGAVLQPSFLLFGTYRGALQAFDPGAAVVEQANRLDLFGNLQLTGTERLLVGVRPLDSNGDFTRYTFRPETQEGGRSELNLRPTTLFFEGDLGELLPDLDPRDRSALDWGFAVGRQPILFQEGMLIDDTLDAVGVTRNTLLPSGAANLRLTGLWGWDDVDRDDNREDKSSNLYGLFAEADLTPSTVTADVVWVDDEDDRTDALFVGAGAVQRIGHLNTAFRALGSIPFRSDTPEASGGALLFAELSRRVHHSEDLVYATAFWGIEEFSSAARGPDRGGPLARAGILFEAVGLGSYGSALGNRADRSVGGAVGRQFFLGAGEDPDLRHQIVVELGGRTDTSGPDASAAAVGARYQRAFGRHLVLRFDGFVTGRENDSAATGLRAELLVKF